MMGKMQWLVCMVIGCAATAAWASDDTKTDERPTVLMVEPEPAPTLTLTWPTREGEPTTLEKTLPYAAPGAKQSIGENIDAYVALGGTRLDRGQGHPDGVIVRVGLYKIDASRPFFEDLDLDAVIELRMDPVRFNQAVRVPHGPVLQHVQFTAAELENCGLPGASRNCFNTADPRDTHTGRLTDQDCRPGALRVRTVNAGAAPEGHEVAVVDPTDQDWLTDGGEIVVSHTSESEIVVHARLPYALLRHIQDPWRVTTPGTFQEPSHFHVEFEVLPAGVPALEPNNGRPPPMPPPKPKPDSER